MVIVSLLSHIPQQLPMVDITSPYLIFLLFWFQLGGTLHRLSRMLYRQSRLTSSCLLAANLWQLSISQWMGRGCHSMRWVCDEDIQDLCCGRWLATGTRSGAGRLAGSLSRSGGSGIVDPLVAELVAKESIAATWDLQRRTDWVEIKQRIFNPDIKNQPGLGKEYVLFNPSFLMWIIQPLLFLLSWLAEAELMTCSNSRHKRETQPLVPTTCPSHPWPKNWLTQLGIPVIPHSCTISQSHTTSKIQTSKGISLVQCSHRGRKCPSQG